jgi:hypothetical protein
MKRSVSRIVFVIGMLIAAIGFLLPMITVEGEGVMNLFSAGVYFNEPGTAFISTFLYAVWIACIAAVIVFFTSHYIIGDFITWLIGAGFGIAAIITLCGELAVNPFGYMFIGSYVIVIGMIVALVALIKEAAASKQ